MIIGNGMLAKAFSTYDEDKKNVIFASGVSNSSETKLSEFSRERELIINIFDSMQKEALFVYFSTCSVHDTYFSKNDYTKHKLEMEKLVLLKSDNYLIVRLPQVVGNSKNKKLLINFLWDSICRNKKFTLYDIERNIIDVEDVVKIVEYFINKTKLRNQTITIANLYNIKVIDIVKTIEDLLSKKAIYEVKRLDGAFILDTSIMKRYCPELVLFDPQYVKHVLKKYFKKGEKC
jgi:nucleoside-diphosphate-sugar epimerase